MNESIYGGSCKTVKNRLKSSMGVDFVSSYENKERRTLRDDPDSDMFIYDQGDRNATGLNILAE